MGVGQPLSMKLKNVHSPQPHPNGCFLDVSVEVSLLLSFSLGLQASLAVVVTPFDVVASGVIFLSCVSTSVERIFCNSHVST